MSEQDVVEAARDYVRVNGYASSNDLCKHILTFFYTAGVLGRIIDQVECDDVHMVKFMDSPSHEQRLFYYNHRTEPLPLRT